MKRPAETSLQNPKGSAEFWGTFGSSAPFFEDRLFLLPNQILRNPKNGASAEGGIAQICRKVRAKFLHKTTGISFRTSEEGCANLSQTFVANLEVNFGQFYANTLGPAKTYILRGTRQTYAIKTRAVTDN